MPCVFGSEGSFGEGIANGALVTLVLGEAMLGAEEQERVGAFWSITLFAPCAGCHRIRFLDEYGAHQEYIYERSFARSVLDAQSIVLHVGRGVRSPRGFCSRKTVAKKRGNPSPNGMMR